MAKSNPSLTSITPHAPAERNFVNIHRDNVVEPTVKDLANKGGDGMTGKSASKAIKVFNRRKFHMGNDEAQSIAGYDPRASQNEAVHIRSIKRTLGKKRTFIDDKPMVKKPHLNKEELTEMTRKDQLGGLEIYHTKKMNDKMDKQMWGKDDPTDPDRTGEISFHHAMRAWAARQRVDSSHIHDTSDFKRHAKFSKEMQKQGREKAAKIKEGEVVALSNKPVYQNRVSGERFRRLQKTNADKDIQHKAFARRNGWYTGPKKMAEEENTLPWLKTIAEKKALTENCVQVSDKDFLAEKVALVKKIILGEKGTQWIGQLGNRVADTKKDKAEIEKSIHRHADKEKKKSK